MKGNLKALKIAIIVTVSASFILLGLFFTTPSTANSGMPDRLLNGEYGQRIDMFQCFFMFNLHLCFNEFHV